MISRLRSSKRTCFWLAERQFRHRDNGLHADRRDPRCSSPARWRGCSRGNSACASRASRRRRSAFRRAFDLVHVRAAPARPAAGCRPSSDWPSLPRMTSSSPRSLTVEPASTMLTPEGKSTIINVVSGTSRWSPNGWPSGGLASVGVAHIGADAADRLREFLEIHGEHERMQPVRPQVADDAGAVVPVLPPAEEPLGAEVAFGSGAEPGLPVHGLRRELRLDRVVPFTVGVVAAVAALRPEQPAHRPGA